MQEKTRAWVDGWLMRIGRWGMLLFRMARVATRPRSWFRATVVEVRRQCRDSIPLVMTVTAMGGALIAQQTGYQFQGSLPSWLVGSITAASLVTEVTPLFTGIVLVGLIGTRITAELAVMQVTEQLDAMEVMGRDPITNLIVPRVFAAAFTGPLLTALGLVMSMLAGWGVALLTTRADSADFWFGVRHYMRDFPMFYALIKALCFSTSIAFIGCCAGLGTRGGSLGVGRSTTAAVVTMMSSVIILDTALVPLLKVIRI